MLEFSHSVMKWLVRRCRNDGHLPGVPERAGDWPLRRLLPCPATLVVSLSAIRLGRLGCGEAGGLLPYHALSLLALLALVLSSCN
mgnify:CR=1 FL=1